MRKVASHSIVLLKNEEDLLPLKADEIKTIAIVGPNAQLSVISGGGSAALKAAYTVTPFEGITSALAADTKILTCEGAQGESYEHSLAREDR
jgi:beta-glucosidase